MTRTAKTIVGVLCILLIASLIWGFSATTARAQIANEMENTYQRDFYDLIACVENLSALTGKVQVASGLQQEVKYLSDIYWYSNMAAASLSELPLEHETLARTERFLNQMAGYVNSVSKKLLAGSELTEENKETLLKLNEQTVTLAKDLRALLNELNESGSGLTPSSSGQKQAQVSRDAGSAAGGFSQINETFLTYPTLVYDGPFSDHMDKRDAKGLTGEAADAKQALARAKSVADSIAPGEAAGLSYLDETSGNAAIPVYCFSAGQADGDMPAGGGPLHIDVSKTGGHIIMINDSRPVQNASISEDAAKEKAAAFLKQLGFEGMKPTYATTQGNSVVFAFAATKNDVMLYPDQVKVKVALDDGQIIGLDAADYYMSHVDRSLPAPKLSLEQAETKISGSLTVESRQTALIPTESGGEVLCYEFRGTYHQNTYLVYINAETGAEENILQVIDTPGGRFTM